MRTRTTSLILLLLVSAIAHAADDVRKTLDEYLAADLKILDDIAERHEKGKLKPAETKGLFGKTLPAKAKRLERLAEIRKEIQAGTFSFARPWGAVNVRQVVDPDSFLGSYLVPGSLPPPTVELFRNIPDTSDVSDGLDITITTPLIATGRYTYKTVGGAAKTVRILEPRSVLIERLAKEKKK